MDACKPTPIHPAVRKLLGKSVRAADVNLLLAEQPVTTTPPVTTTSMTTTSSVTASDTHVARTDHCSRARVRFVCRNSALAIGLQSTDLHDALLAYH